MHMAELISYNVSHLGGMPCLCTSVPISLFVSKCNKIWNIIKWKSCYSLFFPLKINIYNSSACPDLHSFDDIRFFFYHIVL